MKWRIYNSDGAESAACHYAEDAAAIVSILGEGATIRLSKSRIVWTEGAEEFDAGESYDRTAEIVMARLGLRAWLIKVTQ